MNEKWMATAGALEFIRVMGRPSADADTPVRLGETKIRASNSSHIKQCLVSTSLAHDPASHARCRAFATLVTVE